MTNTTSNTTWVPSIIAAATRAGPLGERDDLVDLSPRRALIAADREVLRLVEQGEREDTQIGFGETIGGGLSARTELRQRLFGAFLSDDGS